MNMVWRSGFLALWGMGLNFCPSYTTPEVWYFLLHRTGLSREWVETFFLSPFIFILLRLSAEKMKTDTGLSAAASVWVLMIYGQFFLTCLSLKCDYQHGWGQIFPHQEHMTCLWGWSCELDVQTFLTEATAVEAGGEGKATTSRCFVLSEWKDPLLLANAQELVPFWPLHVGSAQASWVDSQLPQGLWERELSEKIRFDLTFDYSGRYIEEG